jgi:antitoxin ParD1/3/4
MNIQKLSISLPKQQYDFIENYQAEHHYKTRSEVIKEALDLLQQRYLEGCYREANQEIDGAFEATSADGIDEDEAW